MACGRQIHFLKSTSIERLEIMQLDKLKTTEGLDVAGKRVLVRADLNVPVADGRVTDATRLTRLVPGLQDLAKRGAKVVVLSHFGRPKGNRVPEMSLKPVAEALGAALGLLQPRSSIPIQSGAEHRTPRQATAR